jgi:hypothetical protein
MRQKWREGLERYPGDPDLEQRLAMDDTELDRFLTNRYATATRVSTSLRELWAEGDAP